LQDTKTLDAQPAGNGQKETSPRAQRVSTEPPPNPYEGVSQEVRKALYASKMDELRRLTASCNKSRGRGLKSVYYELTEQLHDAVNSLLQLQ
jgi:hypothetical protein